MNRKNPQQSQSSKNTSNVVNIEELAIQAKETEIKRTMQKLEQDNVGLSQTIDKLLKELENKENVILQLEKMLGNTVPIIGDLTLPNEELIAEKQIYRLLEFSKLRELTLDEAKRLDIYVKIKNGRAKADGDDKDSTKGKLKDVTPKQLLEIAAKKIEE